MSIMTLSIAKLCHYPECQCAECRDLFIDMLSVVMLSVVAPFYHLQQIYNEEYNKNLPNCQKILTCFSKTVVMW